MPSETRTAQQAADAAGSAVDQIAKSIMFGGLTSGSAILFITAGGNRVDTEKVAQVASELLGEADAMLVRTQTGFAIGGVAPIGHLAPPRAFWDPRLSDFDLVFSAAGISRRIFPTHSKDLMLSSGSNPGTS